MRMESPGQEPDLAIASPPKLAALLMQEFYVLFSVEPQENSFLKKNESGPGHIICYCSQAGLAANSKQSISKDSDSQRRVNSSEVLIQAFSRCKEQKLDRKPGG